MTYYDNASDEEEPEPGNVQRGISPSRFNGFVDDEDDDEEAQADPAAIDDEVNDNDNILTGSSRRKRSRSPNKIISEQPLPKAIKLHNGDGRPKASDWEPQVKAILALAISLFRGKLNNEDCFVAPLQAMVWAKVSWTEACDMCETWIAYNPELLKLVCCLCSHCSSSNDHLFNLDHRPLNTLPGRS